MPFKNRTAVNGAVFDSKANMLYITIGSDLQAIDTKQWTVESTVKTGRMDMYQVDDPILIGDEIHLFDSLNGEWQHFVVDKSSGNTVQEPTEIPPEMNRFYKAMFIKSTNSIVLVMRNTKDNEYRPMTFEYSMETKQWTNWDWGPSSSINGGAMVVTMDERYILSFGGDGTSEGGYISDSIIIYDLKKRQCVESGLKCPNKTYYVAVMMADQQHGKLSAFGFVKSLFKAPEFRNVQILPDDLIHLIGKWCSTEYVHLIGYNEEHYRVNVDDILESSNCS